MSRITLKDYCSTKGYNRVSKVRLNTNGYPYVTLICAKDTNTSENLYLGVEYGKTVSGGDILPIHELFVAETLNADGEVRMKLTNKEGVLTEAKAADYISF